MIQSDCKNIATASDFVSCFIEMFHFPVSFVAFHGRQPGFFW